MSDTLGKLGSYAGLLYAADTANPEHAKFYGDIQEKLTAITTDLIFFELEINRIDDAVLARALAGPTLARYKPWFDDLRKEKPYQLEEKLERLFHEKSITARAAWNRLFNETMTALRFEVDGETEPLALELTLNLLMHPDEAQAAGRRRSLAKVFKDNIRLFTLITNTLAKDKEISDRWRGFKDVADSRHLANRVEPEVVDALVGSGACSLPAPVAPLLRDEGEVARQGRSSPTGTAMRRCPTGPNASFPGGRREAMVLDAYGAFAPRWRRSPSDSSTSAGSMRRCASGKSPGAFSHPTVPSAHPYMLMNYLGKPRDVMTLAHELGHGVHQVLAAPHGPLLAPTPLTLAETASVFGEMLTFKALLASSTDAKERKALMAQKVEDMINTVVRQIAFYSFERACTRSAGGRAHAGSARRKSGSKCRARAWDPRSSLPRLRELLGLCSPLHTLAVLRLRLCVRRLPGELALRALPGRTSGLRREVLRHAGSRRLQAPFGVAQALRPRCVAARVLGQGPEGDRRHDRRAGKPVGDPSCLAVPA